MKNTNEIVMKASYPMLGIDTINIGTNLDEYLSSESSKIACVGIGVKAACNYDCVYCYAGHSTKRGDLSTEQYLSLIDQAGELGVQTMILTGAGGKSEPGLFKSIVRILERIDGNGITPVIFTNASQFGDDKIANRLGYSSSELALKFKKHNASLIISCESLNPNLYKKITGKSFDGFQTSIRNLLDAGYGSVNGAASSVAISCVVMKDNFDELEKIRDFAHMNGWQFICKFPTLAGSALDNKELFFTPKEASERLNVIESLRDKPETLTVSHENNEYCLANQVGISIDNLGAPLNCLSGSNITSEEHYNIKTASLKEIVREKKRLAKLGLGHCPKKASYYAFKNAEHIETSCITE